MSMDGCEVRKRGKKRCECGGVNNIYTTCMSPTHNRKSALLHFKYGNTIEIRNGIILDFYQGQPHIRFLPGTATFVTLTTPTLIGLSIVLTFYHNLTNKTLSRGETII